MIYRILFAAIISISFVSCNQNKNTANNNTISESISDIEKEDDASLRGYKIPYTKDNIGGYYEAWGYIVFISIDDNNVIIQDFNIINNEYSYNETIRFNFDGYDPKYSIFRNGDNKFIVRFGTMNRYTEFELFITNQRDIYPHYIGNGIWFRYISETINDEIIRYTYDYQKQFIGEYHYHSFSFYGYESEKSIEEFRKNASYTVAIDDDGFLFFASPDWTHRFKITNKDEGSSINGNVPGDGSLEWELYYLNGVIVDKWDFDAGKGYELFYKME
jgi:hypothetical protein